jgi:pyrroline-5-carboxylate reductase
MAKDVKITFIGAGKMGEAIISGVLKHGLTSAECITAAEPHPERRTEITERYGIQCVADNGAAVEGADVVLLSVKPQMFKMVAEDIKGRLPAEALVISIMAGMTTTRISEKLGHDLVVRSMPNTPAQVAQAITMWTCTPVVKETQQSLTRAILTSFGQEIFVESELEKYIDMATAISGSGPAYVYLFIEAWIDAGVQIGFPRRIAEQLVLQTVRGSVEYLDASGDHPAKMRNDVTSSAGTSAAALYEFERAGLRVAVADAVRAAFEKSQELGRNNKD